RAIFRRRCKCAEAPSTSATTTAASAAPTTSSSRRLLACGLRSHVGRIQRRGVNGNCVGRYVLTKLRARTAGRAKAAPPATTAAESAKCAQIGGGDVEYRILIEVDWQVLAIVAVSDRALQVGERSARDRAAREKLLRMLYRHA